MRRKILEIISLLILVAGVSTAVSYEVATAEAEEALETIQEQAQQKTKEDVGAYLDSHMENGNADSIQQLSNEDMEEIAQIAADVLTKDLIAQSVGTTTMSDEAVYALENNLYRRITERLSADGVTIPDGTSSGASGDGVSGATSTGMTSAEKNQMILDIIGIVEGNLNETITKINSESKENSNTIQVNLDNQVSQINTKIVEYEGNISSLENQINELSKALAAQSDNADSSTNVIEQNTTDIANNTSLIEQNTADIADLLTYFNGKLGVGDVELQTNADTVYGAINEVDDTKSETTMNGTTHVSSVDYTLSDDGTTLYITITE